MNQTTETNRAESYWHHKPAKAENNPLFSLPLRVKPILDWYLQSWKPLSEYALFFLLAWLSVVFLQPDFVVQQTEWNTNQWASWSGAVLLRNYAYTIILAAGLHYYFYTRAMQGGDTKFDTRQPLERGRRFLFGYQLHDNMFWTLASGVTIWSAYELLLLWAQQHGHAPVHAWSEGKFWFVAWFFLIPLWLSLHFYVGHRLLHWRPLFRISHAVHHRNICTGPWSGISMHPIEHVIYFSSFLIHFVIPSHPVHILFHCYCMGLSPIFGHLGFESLVVKGRARMALGHYHHQLHHRYFDCNYGAAELPMDVWLGSFDDGSCEARMRLGDQRLKGG